MSETKRVISWSVWGSAMAVAALASGCAQMAPKADAATPTTAQAPACGRTVLTAAGEAVRSVTPGRWVTLAQVEAQLPPAPIAVGFDIDDTLVFPSPAFNAVLNNNDGPAGGNSYGADMRAVVGNPKTWQDIHQQFDRFSLPKETGRQLLAMHHKRGDKIYLITARVGVAGESLEQRMRQMFGVAFAGPIVFTALKSKTEAIKARGITVYYGDSDSDIEYAKEAGAQGIRVLRATNAIAYDKKPCNGRLGEDVIVDSDK